MTRPKRTPPPPAVPPEQPDETPPPGGGGPTRRDFLKGVGAVGLGATAASQVACAPPAGMKTEGATATSTVCPFCGVGCGQTAYTKGDHLLHVEGDPDHPISEGTLCSKGAALSQVTNNPHRLTEVLYHAPGATEFEARSWDWAFQRIAQRVKETRDASFIESVDGTPVNRTEAIACLGGAALDNEECYLLVKAMRAMGITYLEHQARI